MDEPISNLQGYIQSNRVILACNGGVDLATMIGLGPGSLNMVSTSWSPTSSSMSMAPGGQFGVCPGEIEPDIPVTEALAEALWLA